MCLCIASKCDVYLLTYRQRQQDCINFEMSSIIIETRLIVCKYFFLSIKQETIEDFLIILSGILQIFYIDIIIVFY